MTRILIFIMSIILTPNLVMSQSNEDRWKEVQKEIDESKPVSASKIVEEIYLDAKTKNDYDQIIKSLYYLSTLQFELEEDTESKSIYRFEQYYDEENDPVVKALLANSLGKRYAQYLNQNSWRIQNRTELQEEVDGDILTYSIPKLIDKANLYFTSSIIVEDELRKVKCEDVQDLINIAKDFHSECDLYLILAMDAVKHFTNTNHFLTTSVNEFELNQNDLFGTIDEYSAIYFEPSSSFSKKRFIAELFQNLLHDYGASSEFNKIKLNIERLRFMRSHAVSSNNEEAYGLALEGFHDKNKESIHAEIIEHELMNYYMANLPFHTHSKEKNQRQIDNLNKVLPIISKLRKSKMDGFKGAAYDAGQVIEQKELNIISENAIGANKEALLYASYRNLTEVSFRIVEVDNDSYSKILQKRGDNQYLHFKNHKSIVEWTEKLPKGEDHISHSIELVIPPLAVGQYVLLAYEGSNFISSKLVQGSRLHVSDLAYYFSSIQGQHELVVMNRESGEPIPNAKVEVFSSEYNRSKRITEFKKLSEGNTNQDGVLEVTKNGLFNRRNNLQFKISKGQDYLQIGKDYSYITEEHETSPRKEIIWFTDRAIYRPGQIVHFKGILLDLDKMSIPTIPQKQELNIFLRDANYQEVETQNISTDEYGSFYGSFIIPESGLNGNYSLSVEGHGGKNFRVEEYKRPKFQPSFEDSQKEFKIGDTVTVNALAKTFSGIVLDGAKYKYTIYRQSYLPWYRSYFYCGFNPWPQSGRVLIKRDNGIVNKDGSINIEFLAKAEENQSSSRFRPSYYFTVELEVIDINGETQATSKRYNFSEELYQINANHQSHLPKGEELNFEINFTNFDNQGIDKKGELLFSKVDLRTNQFKNKYWDYPEFHKLSRNQYRDLFPFDLYSIDDHPYQQKSGSLQQSVPFNTSESKQVKVKNLDEGLYLVQMKVDGEMSEYSSYVQIFKDEIKGISELKIVGANSIYSKGETAEFQFVNNNKDSKVYYTLFKKGKKEESRWLPTGKKQKIKIDEEAFGNLIIKGISIRNNRFYETRQVVEVPWKHKELDIEYTTFRDNLLPGVEEEFTIKVGSPKGLSSQVTLAMYDASLDAFVKNYWTGFSYPTYDYIHESISYSFATASSRLMSKYRNIYYGFDQTKLYPDMIYGNYYFGGINQMLSGRAAGVRVRGSRSKESAYAMDGVALSKSAPMAADTAEEMNYDDAELQNQALNEENTSNQKIEKAPPLRKNLEETVFFYPQLSTNPDGELSYTFKMKEAITEWKLLSFAHTKEADFGYDERTLITKKDLLIQANMPRFLRAGDKIEFSSKVSNLSEAAISGTARLEILNAITEEPIHDQLIVGNQLINFDIPKGENSLASWTLDVPADFIMPVIVRVYAESGKHTDGEQNMLSVLTNRKLLTATKSMMVRPNTVEEFSFKHLIENIDSPTLDSYSYQLEFTTNPIWFAIKAMPYLKNVDTDYNTNLADQLFANILASSIIEKYPQIKNVFEAWKKDPEALKSELEKNEELKSILINETPWVRQSQSEEEQRRDIALLFEFNLLNNQLENNIQLLANRQDSNGGFSWRAKGRDSWFVSQYIMEQLVKLKHLGMVDNELLNQVIDKGMQYLDLRVKEYYKDLEKRKFNQKYLSPSIIHYSYIQSMYQERLFGDISTIAKAYFKKAFEEKWTEYSPYMQGMIALAHVRSGEPTLSHKIKSSLLERVIKSEQLGAYWKSNNAYSWYNLGIEQQAMMIEYFEEITGHQELVDEMKMWLLTKKQTTHWPTSKSTAASIYALLNNSRDWIEENKQIEVWVGKDKQKINRQESGTGQFELNLSLSDLSKESAQIKVNNPNDYLIWGSAYWQYWQDLDKIQSADENPFTIKKEVFKRVETDEGEVLVPVDQDSDLQQGNKLSVRIELRTDRDLDYVHMQDMRAAGSEPINVLSQYKYQDGLSYYESTKDRYTDFFFERLARGTYVFSYEVRVTHKGNFSNGITTAQCLYAPSFSSQSVGQKLSFQ